MRKQLKVIVLSLSGFSLTLHEVFKGDARLGKTEGF